MYQLTSGLPWKVIIRFTVPIFIGNVLQQLYQMVDTMIVGQCIGSQAFAAVGAANSIYSLVTGFVWGTTAGFFCSCGSELRRQRV